MTSVDELCAAAPPSSGSVAIELVENQRSRSRRTRLQRLLIDEMVSIELVEPLGRRDGAMCIPAGVLLRDEAAAMASIATSRSRVSWRLSRAPPTIRASSSEDFMVATDSGVRGVHPASGAKADPWQPMACSSCGCSLITP